jgi:mannose-6-phosphate isomerase-like protein (cupin superfamily)
VPGRGTVILDGEPNVVVSGSGINIPVGTKHRVINDNETQDLVFVEISSGQFDEDDIERYEDDYGRAK